MQQNQIGELLFSEWYPLLEESRDFMQKCDENLCFNDLIRNDEVANAQLLHSTDPPIIKEILRSTKQISNLIKKTAISDFLLTSCSTPPKIFRAESERKHGLCSLKSLNARVTAIQKQLKSKEKEFNNYISQGHKSFIEARSQYQKASEFVSKLNDLKNLNFEQILEMAYTLSFSKPIPSWDEKTALGRYLPPAVQENSIRSSLLFRTQIEAKKHAAKQAKEISLKQHHQDSKNTAHLESTSKTGAHIFAPAGHKESEPDNQEKRRNLLDFDV